MYEQPFNPYSANLAAVKDYFKSPKVLVLGILNIVSAIVGLTASLMLSGMIGRYIDDMIKQLNNSGASMNPELISTYAQSGYSASIIIGAVFSFICTALIALGYILIYVKSRSESPASSPKAGVGILYAFAVISLVLMILSCIGAILLIVFVAYLLVNVASSDSAVAAASSIGVVFIGVLLAIIFGYALFVSINRVRFYGSVRQSINSVELQNKGAKPYGIACVINAVFIGISFVSSLTTISGLSGISYFSGLTGVSILGTVSMAVMMAMLIVEAMIALGYKKHIDNLKYGYNTPSGGNPAPYNDQQPYYGNMGAAPRSPYENPGAPYGGDTQNPYETPEQPQPKPYNDGFSQTAPRQSRSDVPQICPYCGAPTENAPFCGNCGAKLK